MFTVCLIWYSWLLFLIDLTVDLYFFTWSLSNKDGQTARDVAMISGFDHAVQYLSQFQSNASHSGIKETCN